MRHKKGFNHLGRKKGHRRAMLANMASSLIVHKRITTTVAKAKALRMYIEPLITKSKDDATHSRRVVFSYLNDKVATAELFREVSPKVADRPGGYTRIIKLATRLGDNADMAMIELVDFNELLLTEAKPKKARRSRRGGAKKTEADAPAAEDKVEEPKSEVADEAVEAPDAKVDEPKAEEKKDDSAEEGEEKKA
ncbi:MAG: large subunit ribosomal protein L17 [Bacteroidia bacterium]|jgi:large subunit ribosomal protein L17